MHSHVSTEMLGLTSVVLLTLFSLMIFQRIRRRSAPPQHHAAVERSRTITFDLFYHGRTSLSELTTTISPRRLYRTYTGSLQPDPAVELDAPPIRELVAAMKDAAADVVSAEQMPIIMRPPMVQYSSSGSVNVSDLDSPALGTPTAVPLDQPRMPAHPRSLSSFRGRSFTISKRGSLRHHVEDLTVRSRPASLSQLRRVRKLGEGGEDHGF